MASGFGEHPIVLVPQDDDPEVVIYGRISTDFTEPQSFMTIRDPDSFQVKELPLPTWVQ